MYDFDSLLESQGLFQTTLPNGGVVNWRLLTLREVKILEKLKDSFHDLMFYDMIFERCYVGDAALLPANLPFGSIVSIGHLIYELSKEPELNQFRDTIFAARNRYGSHFEKIILLAFPTLLPKDLDNITFPEFIRLFVTAEAMLELKYNIEQGCALSVRAEKPTPIFSKLGPKDFIPAEDKNRKPIIDFNRENANLRKDLEDVDSFLKKEVYDQPIKKKVAEAMRKKR